MNTTIRIATLIDVPSIAKMLSNWLVDLEDRDATSFDWDRLYALSDKMISDPNSVVLVATIMKKGHEKRIGMASFSIQLNEFLGEYMAVGKLLYVDPRYRGHTLAKQLIESAEKFAISHTKNITRMRISTIAPGLFKRIGWKEDCTIMTKRVVK